MASSPLFCSPECKDHHLTVPCHFKCGNFLCLHKSLKNAFEYSPETQEMVFKEQEVCCHKTISIHIQYYLNNVLMLLPKTMALIFRAARSTCPKCATPFCDPLLFYQHFQKCRTDLQSFHCHICQKKLIPSEAHKHFQYHEAIKKYQQCLKELKIDHATMLIYTSQFYQPPSVSTQPQIIPAEPLDPPRNLNLYSFTRKNFYFTRLL